MSVLSHPVYGVSLEQTKLTKSAGIRKYKRMFPGYQTLIKKNKNKNKKKKQPSFQDTTLTSEIGRKCCRIDHYLSKYCFSPILPLLPSSTLIIQISAFWLCLIYLLLSALFLLFWCLFIVFSHSLDFQFTNPGLYGIQSSVKPIQWFLNFKYYIFSILKCPFVIYMFQFFT